MPWKLHETMEYKLMVPQNTKNDGKALKRPKKAYVVDGLPFPNSS